MAAKRPRRQTLRLRDERGGRTLLATWSRSAKHAMVSVSPHILDPIAQVSLGREDARRLTELLDEPGSPSVLELVDDEANELRAEWDARGRWVVVEALPPRNSLTGDAILGDERASWPRDPTRIGLAPDQAEELARFLRAAPSP